MSRTIWAAAAVLTFLSGASAQHGMAQTMTHTMMHGAMKHDMTAMPPLDSMIKRAEVLVWRTEAMMRTSADPTANGMATERPAIESPQAMVGSLNDMAIGLRGALRHMDAMHRAGMKMEGDPGAAMMDVHRRMNIVLGELEQMLQPTERMHAHHAKMRP
ncbi:MAG: hypothetical protein ACYC7F_03070 [Gemmatimonadaceae bacterium]